MCASCKLPSGGKAKEYDKILKVSLPSDVVPKKKVLGKLTEEERNDFVELFELYDTDESVYVDIFEFKVSSLSFTPGQVSFAVN